MDKNDNVYTIGTISDEVAQGSVLISRSTFTVKVDLFQTFCDSVIMNRRENLLFHLHH